MSNETKVTIIRSNRKTLSIELKSNEIIARAPARMKEKEIYKFIESKKSWIDKHLTKLNERQKVLDDLKPYTQEEIKQFTEKTKIDIPLINQPSFYIHISIKLLHPPLPTSIPTLITTIHTNHLLPR